MRSTIAVSTNVEIGLTATAAVAICCVALAAVIGVLVCFF